MSDFKALQKQFAGHIRNPEVPIIPGIEDRRMKIYRDLFFNNVEGFTSTAFPVAKSLMGEVWWQQAVKDFLKDYRCESPYFNTISSEFLTYISEIRTPQDSEPAYLRELMHYEWVELALDISEGNPLLERQGLSEDLMNGHPVLSSVAWSLSYEYPVHQIGKAYQPTEKPEQPTWLMVYRNADEEVQFMELNAITAHLIHLLTQDDTLSGQDAILLLAEQLNYEEPAQLIPAGQQILEQFYSAGILLGARPLEGTHNERTH